jgi:signal peptidase II
MRAVPGNRYVVFFSIVIAGCLIDLATKSWMFGWLGMPGGRTWWIWPNVLGLQTSLNEGALFGMGQGMTAGFTALSIVAVLGIVFCLFYMGAGRDWLLTVALACATAGILGNLYDRLGLPGLKWDCANRLHQVGEPVRAVRDWILVIIGPINWPNFNVADSLMVCAAALVVWHALAPRRREKPEKVHNGESATDGQNG